MHAKIIAGLVLALASTTLISLSYLREHRAVSALPPLSLRRPLASLTLLLTNRRWLGGFALETGGFGVYVAALALAPLALVQSVAAGGIGILAVGSARVAHRRLSTRERAGATVAIVGLVALAISLSSGQEPSTPGSTVGIAAWIGGAAALALAAAVLGRPLIGSAANGIAGGLLFAAGDISTKVLTEGGGRLLFALPTIAGYVLGSALLQIGYQSGGALTVAGTAALLANAVPIAAGTVVLGETVPGGALGALRIVAFVTVIAGAVLLARRAARATDPAALPFGGAIADGGCLTTGGFGSAPRDHGDAMLQGFEISVLRNGSSVRLVVSGELDVASAPALLAHVEGVAGDPGEELVLDLRQVAFIDSTGLRALLSAYEICGDRLTIVPGQACERLFDVAGVREHLPLVEP